MSLDSGEANSAATNEAAKKHTYRKEVRPSQAVLESLDLQPGRNAIAFTVSSLLQGEKTVHASLYLWSWRDKIVVSDIDGTITRSDVFGQVLPSLGKDWSHAGVARLFQNISANRYNMLYLTSRPIGSANRTRAYIMSLKQQGDVTLPEGPMLMCDSSSLARGDPFCCCCRSPERLLSAFQQEVIKRRADIFKTQCLADIRRLFPSDVSPFYAGFGNRSTEYAS